MAAGDQRYDGGPAFPQGNPEMVRVGQPVEETQGMTLRDWFAGQALMGLMSGHNAIAMNDDNIILRYPNAFAAFSYQLADAMLETRQDQPTNRERV